MALGRSELNVGQAGMGDRGEGLAWRLRVREGTQPAPRCPSPLPDPIESRGEFETQLQRPSEHGLETFNVGAVCPMTLDCLAWCKGRRTCHMGSETQQGQDWRRGHLDSCGDLFCSDPAPIQTGPGSLAPGGDSPCRPALPTQKGPKPISLVEQEG